MAVAELLRSARTQRGLTLEQVANQTKIRLDHLAAFERDGLPHDGGFYQRARLRSYAEALGLDYRVVLEQLDQEIRAAAPLAPPEPPPPLPRRFGVPHVAVTAAGCVVIAMIGTAWLGREPRRIAHPAPAVRSAPHAPARAESRPVAVVVADHSPSAVVPHVSVAVSPASISTVDAVERTPVPVETTGVVPAVMPASLVIVTRPVGARVTVDGIGWGMTPVTIPNLPEGLKRIRVTSDGYAAVERAIEVQPNRANEVVLQLEPLPPAAVEPAP